MGIEFGYTVIKFRCDACDTLRYQTTHEETGMSQVRDAKAKAIGDGWTSQNGKLLCPKCSEKVNKMLSKEKIERIHTMISNRSWWFTSQDLMASFALTTEDVKQYIEQSKDALLKELEVEA